MSTFLLTVLDELVSRWAEIGVLIDLAEATIDPTKHSAICRSATVLMVSHFEGIVRDAAKAVVADLNRSLKFHELPVNVKRKHCSSLLFSESGKNDGKEFEERRRRLSAALELLSNGSTAGLSHEMFLAADPASDRPNRNPSPEILERVLGNFGVTNFFKLVADSEFDQAFTGLPPREMVAIIEKTHNHLKNWLTVFPYAIDYSKFGIVRNDSRRTPTLWEDFLNNLLRQRHKIAHGSEVTNTKSPDEIKNDFYMIQLLSRIFILVLAKGIF